MTRIFASDELLFSQTLKWQCVDWVIRTLWIDPKTFCIGFPRDCFLFRIQWLRVWRDAFQLWCNSHNSHNIVVIAFSSSVGMAALFRLWNWWYEKNYLSFFLHPVSVLLNWYSERSTHKTISCKYLSKKNLHGYQRMTSWLLLSRILRFLDTLRPRDIDDSERVTTFNVDPVTDAFRLWLSGDHSRLGSWRWKFTKNADFITVSAQSRGFWLISKTNSFMETRCRKCTEERSKCTAYSADHSRRESLMSSSSQELRVSGRSDEMISTRSNDPGSQFESSIFKFVESSNSEGSLLEDNKDQLLDQTRSEFMK